MKDGNKQARLTPWGDFDSNSRAIWKLNFFFFDDTII